ncbi:glycosyltransferase family 2 protein [Mucilaginibacter sp. BJC16-A38]|uniref:glycosyltransferase family 2 protein n=1 Tax=Mucilaginibacter phenanthrenivorans TaxID=1234842 RepID=UPI002157D50B|nr:glycosyltransferase family A protein [Mucilaginibacter phenanthrenivorans]MCR8560185.1 glycosyltransferase family 2 protein [Mucilaginibacter phenanthrenivorans]
MISVIIPNYNHAAFLKQRIESVLNQTYPDIEVILLDDFSRDNSREIIAAYTSHPKVSHIVYNDSNSGSVFRQWNKGMALAKGNYIWIAESDDYADPAFLDTCMTVFTNDPAVGVVYCDSYEVNENNEVMGKWSRWQSGLSKNLWQSDFLASGKTINENYQQIANVIPNASCAVFKKAAYLESPFIQLIENLKFTGDWMMWFSIMQNSKIYYFHQPLNYFRYHAGTTRSDSAGRLQNVKEHYRAIYRLGRLAGRKPDNGTCKDKFCELYAAWNPSLRQFLNRDNLGILRFALLTDYNIGMKLFKTLMKKIYVI